MFNDELLSGITDSLTGLDGRVGELERKENPAEGGTGPFTYEVHVAIAGGGDFSSVKDAADYVLLTAQASEYWTIVVHSGEYEEAAFELPVNTALVGIGNAFISSIGITAVAGTYITLADNCTMRNITLTLNMDPTSADCWAVECAGYIVLENCYILVNKLGGVGSSQSIGVVSTLTGDVNNCWLRLRTQEASYPGSRRVIQYIDPNSAQLSYLRDCTLGFDSADPIADDVSITVYVEGHSLWIIDCTIQKRTSTSAGFDIRAGSGGTAYTSGTFYVKTFGTVTNLDAAAGSGGVTSVTVSASSGNGVITTSGSPITTSGTITISFFQQTAWTVFARQGTDGAPSFQLLQAGHIPNLPASKITSGTLGPGNGGTGAANTGNLTWGAATDITGGGTVALGGFTATVPESLTVAGRNVANTFSAAQTISVAGTGLTVDNDGWIKNHFAIGPGTAGPAGAAITLDVLEVFTSDGSGGASNPNTVETMRFIASLNSAGASTTTINGVEGSARIASGNAQNHSGSVNATFLNARHSGSGTLANIAAALLRLTVDSGATATNARSLYVDSPVINGSVTNLAGVVVAAHTSANATNKTHLLIGQTSVPSGNHAIYSSSSYTSYINGPALFGRTTGLAASGDVDANGRVRGATFETSAGNKWALAGFTAAGDAASNGYVSVVIDGATYKLSTRA